MWPDSAGPEDDAGHEKRPSTSSEVATLDSRLAAAVREAVPPANLNINKSSKVHVGPKLVTVTQHIQSNDVVKGRLLCLELVSPSQSRRLRCSVAIFVCWALVVAAGLAVYLFRFAIHQTRLDIDLPLHKYIWSVIKNTTRAERLSCGIALLLVVICNLLIVYFTVIVRTSSSDVAPHEWMITREMWLGRHYNHSERTQPFEPLRLVIVQHTVSTECATFNMCAAEMRQMQNYYLDDKGWDIPYNFLVGNDGRIYEGRGWGVVGAHTKGYNLCSVGIGFVGDYREEKDGHTVVTAAQLNRTLVLLGEGVRRGVLDENYLVVGARDLSPTASPGSNLYRAIQQWEHYDHLNRFQGMNCTQIHEAPFHGGK